MKGFTKSISILILIFILIVTPVSLSGCMGKKTIDPAKVSGSIVFATPSWNVDFAKNTTVKEFNEVYPNVTVTVKGFDGALNDYLTTQAASKTMPDVVSEWEDVTYPVSQGWVYPLNDYLKNDADSKYIPQNVLKGYTFGGQVYALPTGLQFNTIMVNKDLVDQLNMDTPPYTWTIDQFKTYLVKATTDKTSGINNLYGFENPMIGILSKDLGELGYNDATQKFDFTSGSFVKAMNLEKELLAIPGLVSDNMRNSDLENAGKLDDYWKKFGKNADAVNDGKVLTAFGGTWDFSWISTLNYKYDMIPLPTDSSIGYREDVHADNAYMMSTTKYPDAAFSFLKFITYSQQGNLDQLKDDQNVKDANGNPTPGFNCPPTNDPVVVKAFNDDPVVPEGIKYLYNHDKNNFRCDHYKFVPGWSDTVNKIIGPATDQIRVGKADPAAVAADLQEKANASITAARNEFDKELAQVQANFPTLRKQIEDQMKGKSK